MITHYRDFINPVCDLCGHMLGSEDGDQLAREAMARDGWVKQDGKDVCRMCQLHGRAGKIPKTKEDENA